MEGKRELLEKLADMVYSKSCNTNGVFDPKEALYQIELIKRDIERICLDNHLVKVMDENRK